MFGRGGRGAWGATLRGGWGRSSLADPTRHGGTVGDGRGSVGDDTSPVGNLRRRFFGAREGGQETAAARAVSSTTSAARSSEHPERQVDGGGGGCGDDDGGKRGDADWEQQMRPPAHHGRPRSSSSIASVATAARGRSSMDRISQSQPRSAKARRVQQQHVPRSTSAAAGEHLGDALPPSSSSDSARASRPLSYGGGGGAGRSREPDTSRLSASPGLARQESSLGGLQGFSGRQQQQQQQQRQRQRQRQRQGVAMVKQPPETPGRPPRPAWQNSNGNGSDSGSGGGISGGDTGMQTPGGVRQASSPLAQHLPQHRRSQVLAGVRGTGACEE